MAIGSIVSILQLIGSGANTAGSVKSLLDSDGGGGSAGATAGGEGTRGLGFLGDFLGDFFDPIVGEAFSALGSGTAGLLSLGGGGRGGSVADQQFLQNLFAGPQISGDLLRHLFGDKASNDNRQDLEDFLENPLALFPAEEQAPRLAFDIQNSLPALEAAINTNVLPFARELGATGNKTDVEPFADAALTRFIQDIVPQTAEQFAGDFGTIVNSSDAGAEFFRQGRRLATDITALDVELAEAAANRQAAFLPELLQLESFFPAFATDITASTQAIGERGRAAAESVRPGGRLFQALVGGLGRSSAEQQFLAPFTPGPPGLGGGGRNAFATAAPGLISGGASLTRALSSLFNRPTTSAPAGFQLNNDLLDFQFPEQLFGDEQFTGVTGTQFPSTFA